MKENILNDDLIREANLLNRCDNENIVKLIEITYEASKLRYIIMEYMKMGDLRTYLIKNRSNKDSAMSNQFLSIMKQISNGCLYLEAKQIVHRDLAARNCLLNKDQNIGELIVKISDLGLARNMYTYQKYIPKSRKTALPIRWMSPESIFDALFTSKSDVWSFGILCYEIYNFGAQPYPGLSNDEVIRSLEFQTIPNLPDNCPTLM
jgi:serine/threonine protein kinase